MTKLKHHYGPQVHIIDGSFYSSVLARLCSPHVFQPEINHLVKVLYSNMITGVINTELEQAAFLSPTRMTAQHPDQFLSWTGVKEDQRVVIVNIARAGTYPSHVCFEQFHYVVPQAQIRQDHIFASRMTDDRQHVTGSDFGGMKIGGDILNAHVVFPDPMGATGNTIVAAVDYYKKHVKGPPKKWLALHLIVTPEYLKKITQAHPEVIVYALRVDRGMSPQKVIKAEPGLYWNEEKGLNDKDYIVPGGGGFGEIMNNSFV